jgi:hypothetical protein
VELLFIALGGALIGLLARYTMPYRHTHGTVLIPAFGAGLASALWVALTWAGLKWNGGWIWWITLIATTVVTFGIDLLIGALRTRYDEAALQRFERAGVPSPRA